MNQERTIKPVEIGECIICRVVISGLRQSFMNVQGGVNLTRVGQEYQLYLRTINGAIPDMIISETVKASYSRVLPALQLKAVIPIGVSGSARSAFLNMAYYMVCTFCNEGAGEAIVTIDNMETKLYG